MYKEAEQHPDAKFTQMSKNSSCLLLQYTVEGERIQNNPDVK